MTPAEVAALLIPLLPTLERWFKEAWGRTDDFAAAWGFLKVLVPEETRAAVEVALRAVWDLYDDGQVDEAWTDLRKRLDAGEGIERAEDVSFADVVKRQHEAADVLPNRSPVAAPEFDPPRDPWARDEKDRDR